MTESDYLKATNRAKVSAALVILRDVLAGDDYGVSTNQMAEIKMKLYTVEKQLFDSYETKEDK